MITNLLFCISSPDVTCLHVLQAPWINALHGRGTHSATTTSRLCGLMRTCIAATRKVSHVFIYTYKLKVSGAHAPLGPTVDTPLVCMCAYVCDIHTCVYAMCYGCVTVSGCMYLITISCCTPFAIADDTHG